MYIRLLFSNTVCMLLLYVAERIVLICINSNKSLFVISNYNSVTGLLQVIALIVTILISFGLFYENELAIISGKREEDTKHLLLNK